MISQGKLLVRGHNLRCRRFSFVVILIHLCVSCRSHCVCRERWRFPADITGGDERRWLLLKQDGRKERKGGGFE